MKDLSYLRSIVRISFTTLKNEHASCSSIYENILRQKNELHVKVLELQTENDGAQLYSYFSMTQVS